MWPFDDFSRRFKLGSGESPSAYGDMHASVRGRAIQEGQMAARREIHDVLKEAAHTNALADATAFLHAERNSFAYRAGRDGFVTTAYRSAKGKVAKAGKTGLVVGGVVAGVAALGVMASSWRKDRAKASRDEIQTQSIPANDGIPPVMTAQDMMAMQSQQQANPLLPPGVEPVVGDHTVRVMAGRGMAPQMSAGVNPAMNVVDGPVENLGPARVPGP